jgi:hypothetical protein
VALFGRPVEFQGECDYRNVFYCSRSLTRSSNDGVGAGDGFSANKIPGANKQPANPAIDKENKPRFILERRITEVLVSAVSRPAVGSR